MFNKIIRFYNQNRRKVIITILIMAFIVILLHILNKVIEINNSKESSNSNNKISESVLQSKSIITEDKISEKTAVENNNIIDQFVQYCNNKNVDEAYNLLSDDCKNVVFHNNEEEFIKYYYEKIFVSNRDYEKDNWLNSNSKTTYKVTYTNNLIADAQYKSGEIFEDYITVDNSKENIKLNIQNFIGKEDINKTYEDENLKIYIKSKEVFMDYETYNIEFTNKIDKDICLYDTNTYDKWYITNSNSDNNYAEMSAIIDTLFTLKQGESEEMDVSYDKRYNPDKEVKSITFENIQYESDSIVIKF